MEQLKPYFGGVLFERIMSVVFIVQAVDMLADPDAYSHTFMDNPDIHVFIFFLAVNYLALALLMMLRTNRNRAAAYGSLCLGYIIYGYKHWGEWTNKGRVFLVLYQLLTAKLTVDMLMLGDDGNPSICSILLEEYMAEYLQTDTHGGDHDPQEIDLAPSPVHPQKINLGPTPVHTHQSIPTTTSSFPPPPRENTPPPNLFIPFTNVRAAPDRHTGERSRCFE